MGAIFLVIVLFLILIISAVVNRVIKDNKMLAPLVTWVERIAFCFFAFLFLLNCGTTVSTGSVGVKVFLSSVRPGYIPEGFHFKNPFLNVKLVSIQLKSMSEDAAANIVNLSKDQLEMTVDATQPYRLLPSAAAWVYQNIGDEKDLYEQILLPAARASVRNAVSKFNAQELVSIQRDAFAVEVNRCNIMAVDSMLANYPTSLLPKPNKIVELPVALVRNIALPKKLKDAIEDKLEAQQQSEQMAFVISKARQEADRKAIEARGIQMFQEIVTQGITENLLKWKGIEATEKLAMSPNTKFVIMSSDKLPVILSGDK